MGGEKEAETDVIKCALGRGDAIKMPEWFARVAAADLFIAPWVLLKTEIRDASEPDGQVKCECWQGSLCEGGSHAAPV
jgi:hypothetical protein